MIWVDTIKDALPEYAKDVKLNLDAVLLRSSLHPVIAHGCAVAAAMATGNGKLLSVIEQAMEDDAECNAALIAATIMAQNNVWYPYVEMADDPALKGLPAGLRMNGIVNHGGVSKINFESYSLAASIVGKCHFCVKAHYDTLKKEGMTVERLRDIGRFAAVINSVAKVLNE